MTTEIDTLQTIFSDEISEMLSDDFNQWVYAMEEEYGDYIEFLYDPYIGLNLFEHMGKASK